MGRTALLEYNIYDRERQNLSPSAVRRTGSFITGEKERKRYGAEKDHIETCPRRRTPDPEIPGGRDGRNDPADVRRQDEIPDLRGAHQQQGAASDGGPGRRRRSRVPGHARQLREGDLPAQRHRPVPGGDQEVLPGSPRDRRQFPQPGHLHGSQESARLRLSGGGESRTHHETDVARQGAVRFHRARSGHGRARRRLHPQLRSAQVPQRPRHPHP